MTNAAAPAPVPAPQVDPIQTAALPSGEIVVKFSTPEQIHAAVQVGLQEAQRETGRYMAVRSLHQTHTPPSKPGEPHVYELWATYSVVPEPNQPVDIQINPAPFTAG